MLFNRGEPFLHTKIYDMIKYAQLTTNVILSTNAILVDVDKLYSVFTHGTLCVSMPGGTKETYEKLTGGDNYELVKAKVIELQAKKPNGVEFYVKLVRQAENEGEEEELKKFAHMVHCVDDSNQPNVHGYTTCSQPDITPTWDWRGDKKVCCRASRDYGWEENQEKGRARELDICQNCNIC
jgi:MoaA/NifB/PqqE/SkfB family radical SAM enzyme